MDSIDKGIWILPFLAVLDVISTFSVIGQDYPLQYYEYGMLASFFVRAGTAYVSLYIFIYLLIIVGFSYMVSNIKSRRLKRSEPSDKILFLLLVSATCYAYTRLTVAFSMNFFLPLLVARSVDLVWLSIVVGLGASFSLMLYIWPDLRAWVESNGKEK